MPLDLSMLLRGSPAPGGFPPVDQVNENFAAENPGATALPNGSALPPQAPDNAAGNMAALISQTATPPPHTQAIPPVPGAERDFVKDFIGQVNGPVNLNPATTQAIIGKTAEGKDVETGALAAALEPSGVNPLANPLTGQVAQDPAMHPVEDAIAVSEKMGTGLGDIIGDILGVGKDLVQDVGGILGDSITPNGQISISSLLNLGGKRDRLREARAAETKAASLRIEAMEQDLRSGETARQQQLAAQNARPEVIAQIQRNNAELGIQQGLAALKGRSDKELQDTLQSQERELIGIRKQEARDRNLAKRERLRNKRARQAEDRRFADRTAYAAYTRSLPGRTVKQKLTNPDGTPRIDALTGKQAVETVTRDITEVDLDNAQAVSRAVRDKTLAMRKAMRKSSRNGGRLTEKEARERNQLMRSAEAKIKANPNISEQQAMLSAMYENNPVAMRTLQSNIGRDGTQAVINEVVGRLAEAKEIFDITPGLEAQLSGENFEVHIIGMLESAGVAEAEITAVKGSVFKAIQQAGL